MKFISVHQKAEEILVNTAHIVKIEQKVEGRGDQLKYTVLHLTDVTQQPSLNITPLLRVDESFEELKKMLV